MSREIDHSMDGTDPDAPRPYLGAARRLVDDRRELERMSEAEKTRYAGGSRHNSISRG